MIKMNHDLIMLIHTCGTTTRSLIKRMGYVLIINENDDSRTQYGVVSVKDNLATYFDSYVLNIVQNRFKNSYVI